jgi:hypothetical protein
MRATKKKPPPDVIYVVVDRSDVFSHSVHTTKGKAVTEARHATEAWCIYQDRGPFQVVKYVRA